MNFKTAILPTAAILMLSSCNNPVFDEEGDCDVNYYINFVYDMNLKWADAFPSEVHSVNLYAFDNNGKFVKEFTAAGSEIDEPGYQMQLDLTPGDYQFVAWCGLDNEGASEESFSVPDLQVGVTTIEELSCSLNTAMNSEYGEYSKSRLYFLYHGYLAANLPDAQDGIDRYYTVYLTKDTNHIQVTLQQIDENLETDAIKMDFTAANGIMGWNNALASDSQVTYLPWNIQSDVVAVSGDGENDEVIEYNGIIADFSTCRLMADDADNVWLTVVRAEDDNLIARIPFIKYALISKSYYEMAYGHQMTDQEFLDREDEYTLTIFLDKGMRWLYTEIDILEWKVVIKNYDVS